MDTRYPMSVSLDKPIPRFVAPKGVIESPLGTWVPIEYVEALAKRTKELESALYQPANFRAMVAVLEDEERAIRTDREAAASYLRGHAEEALDSTTRAALFWAADHIESGDHLAQEALPSPKSPGP